MWAILRPSGWRMIISAGAMARSSWKRASWERTNTFRVRWADRWGSLTPTRLLPSTRVRARCVRPYEVVVKIAALGTELVRVWVFWVWVGGLRPVGMWGHLQGENIRLYNLFSPVMMITWWMKLGGNWPHGDNPLLFSISGTGSFICPVTQTRLDIPRPLLTQSHRHGWTYQGLWLPSHTDTAGHTKAFIYPVTQTRLDIPRPLITQSHRHGWTYQGLC